MFSSKITFIICDFLTEHIIWDPFTFSYAYTKFYTTTLEARLVITKSILKYLSGFNPVLLFDVLYEAWGFCRAFNPLPVWRLTSRKTECIFLLKIYFIKWLQFIIKVGKLVSFFQEDEHITFRGTAAGSLKSIVDFILYRILWNSTKRTTLLETVLTWMSQGVYDTTYL